MLGGSTARLARVDVEHPACWTHHPSCHALLPRACIQRAIMCRTCFAISRPGSGWPLVPSRPVRGLGEPQWPESKEVARDSMAPAAYEHEGVGIRVSYAGR